MRILPINFTGSMVRAILREIERPGSGKTQTRRVIKPVEEIRSVLTMYPEYHNGKRSGSTSEPEFTDASEFNGGKPLYFGTPICPGDHLYVREAWRTSGALDDTAPRDLPKFAPLVFEADGFPKPSWRGRFRQGMHMPRWASRITLIVTSVKVERLHDISEEDAIAEGVERLDSCDVFHVDHDHHAGSASTTFCSLWDSLNATREGGKYAWEKNPWVAAYTFRPILGNVDQIAEAA